MKEYLDFARDDYDRDVLLTYAETNSQRRTAESLKLSKSAVQRVLARLKKAYEKHHGLDAPVGYYVKGVSRYTELPNGDKAWVKTNISAEEQAELMRAAIEAMKEEVEPVEPVKQRMLGCNGSLLNCFIVTDYHLGMKAWPEECHSEGWDLDIAENLLIDWFSSAIRSAPLAKHCVFSQLGDFLHWDNALYPITPASGNVLDGDSRTQKVVRTAIRVLRKVTQMLLETHETVHLIMAEGNHDPASSIWLREMFHAMYENEPRITVELSPDPYYCYEHGLTSLFFHHGHKRKIANIDTVFAAKFREVFGRTKFSYGHMGHLHTNKVIESNLMEISQWQTLASPDAYATRGGWISGRSAPVITYHKEFGRVGEIRITPEMVA